MKRLLALVVLLVCPLPLLAAEARPHSIAVLETVPNGPVEVAAARATATLTEYVANTLHLDVVSRDEVKKLVSFEQMQQLAGCEAGCGAGADLGKVLGVEKLMLSSLGKVGERYQLTVTVLDLESGRASGRGAREFRSEDEVIELARDLAHYTLKGEQRESKGYVRVVVPEAGAVVVVDGMSAGVTPLDKPLRLLGGKHTINVNKDGFLPVQSAVDVEPGQERLLEVKLIAKGDIKVAGAGFLPWAGATAGLAVVGGALSGYFYWDAKKTYDERYKADAITKSELDRARDEVDFKGNTLAYWGTIGSAAMGGVSVVLFSAYYLSGLGAGGDAPPADAPALVPTSDGFALHF